MTVQELLYNKVIHDAPMIALGYGAESVFQSQTMDNVPSEVRNFIIIAYGERFPGLSAQRGPGRTFEQLVDFYIYTREKDWNVPSLAAQRVQELADEIVAERTGLDATDGYVSTCEWTGGMPASYDEVYEAMSTVVRWSVIASGA